MDIVEDEEEKGLIVVGIGKGCEAIGVDRAICVVDPMRREEVLPRRKGSLENILLDKFFNARCGAVIVICDKLEQMLKEPVENK